jgi:predicted transcriptional regulator
MVGMTGKVDLAAAILELALKETPFHAIQERMNLSPTTFGQHVRMLQSKALIDVSKADKKVRITKRGAQFLDLYKSIRARYLTIHA